MAFKNETANPGGYSGWYPRQSISIIFQALETLSFSEKNAAWYLFSMNKVP